MERLEPGFAPVCATGCRCAPNRPSFAGSEATRTQPEQLELSGRARLSAWGRELCDSLVSVPELSPD